MRDPQLDRINNRIEQLLDDLTVLKGLERSGSDVSDYIRRISAEINTLEHRKRYLPDSGDLTPNQRFRTNATASAPLPPGCA